MQTTVTDYKIFIRDLQARDELNRIWGFSLSPRLSAAAQRGLDDDLRSDIVALGGMAGEW